MHGHDDKTDATLVIEMTARIVTAYVGNNKIGQGELTDLIGEVQKALALADSGRQEEADKPQPAIDPKKSVKPDYIVCLEDGKRFKSLKRHLLSSHELTPAQYRERWELPNTYPMTAPNYAQSRSQYAKATGLGRKRAKVHKLEPGKGR